MRAAAWSGYPYFPGETWQDLDPADQAYLIAAFQLEREIDALMQHEAAEAARKASKKPARKAP